MPLVVITGFPASGKSTRAAQIKAYFEGIGKTVHIVSERECVRVAGYEKNEYFRDSQKEKLVRSSIKSHVLRLLNKNDLLIIDGGNYIKGYRYEIFCASKNSRTAQCTVYCAITKDQAWSFNEAISEDPSERYEQDVFEALCLRYEEPQHNNRWDSPLFTLFPEEELQGVSIQDALYSQVVKPNLSTQNPPLNTTNFLFEMDRTTQTIIDQVLSARKIGLTGPIKLTSDPSVSVEVAADVKAPQLNRCRRQFLNYMKLHTTTAVTIDKIPSLFVQFLNTNCA